MRKGATILGLALFCVAAVGCGGGSGGPKTVKVSGTLKIDGKAVDGVEVHFVSEKFASFGKTNAEGKFSLVQGAPVGSNKVFFSKVSGGKTKVDLENGLDETQLKVASESAGGAGGLDVAKEVIPADYASETTTKLTFNVPEGGTTAADFDISSK